MKKVNNKKGFTLAELLVVLAILAILVAIAVPLFTGAIGDANDRVIAANIRTLKSAALIQVMSDSTLDPNGPWTATAHIDENGDITNLVIKDGTSGTETTVDNMDSPVGNYTVFVENVDITTG